MHNHSRNVCVNTHISAPLEFNTNPLKRQWLKWVGYVWSFNNAAKPSQTQSDNLNLWVNIRIKEDGNSIWRWFRFNHLYLSALNQDLNNNMEGNIKLVWTIFIDQFSKADFDWQEFSLGFCGGNVLTLPSHWFLSGFHIKTFITWISTWSKHSDCVSEGWESLLICSNCTKWCWNSQCCIITAYI